MNPDWTQSRQIGSSRGFFKWTKNPDWTQFGQIGSSRGKCHTYWKTLTGASLARLGPIGVFPSGLKTPTGPSLARLGPVGENVTPIKKPWLEPIWQDWVQSGFFQVDWKPRLDPVWPHLLENPNWTKSGKIGSNRILQLVHRICG